MLTSMLVIALMAASFSAAPSELQARGSVSSSTSSEHHSETSSKHSATSTPWGQSSSSSYTHEETSRTQSTTAINSWSDIGHQIDTISGMVASGSMTQQLATREMYKIASSFNNAFGSTQSCQTCFQNQQFIGRVSHAFDKFTSLLTKMQKKYRYNFTEVLSPFSEYTSQFQTFFSNASKSRVSVNTILPAQLTPLMSLAVPQFAQFTQTH